MTLHHAILREQAKTYTPEEYATARACAKRWNAATSPIDRQAIEWTLDMGRVSGLVAIRNDSLTGKRRMYAVLDPNRSRCADNHMRIPMLSKILTPVQAAIAGIGLRPWAEASTEEEMHAAAMRMREAY